MNIALRAAGVAALVFTAIAQPAAAQAPTSPGIIPLPLNPIVPADKRTCALKTTTGLGYTQLRAGAGLHPADTDVVLINYLGYLAADGAVFDQAMTTPMPVSDVIPGFTEGLKLLSKGGVFRLCIPAALGYGANATGPIPANSNLVFQVELLDFKSRAEIEAAQKAQGAAEAAAPAPAPKP